MGFGSASTNGKYMTGFRASSRRSGTTPALDWRNFPDHVRTYTDRMLGVVIENKRALDVIEQHDDRETLIYCDPPYPHETRNMRRGNACYTHEMTNADHEQLAAALRVCRGMVIVSSYPNKLYDRLFKDWTIEQCNTFADGARERREVLYLNPACARAQRQVRLPFWEVA